MVKMNPAVYGIIDLNECLGETITANRSVVTRQLHMESFVRKEVLLLDVYLFCVHQNYQIRNWCDWSNFWTKTSSCHKPRIWDTKLWWMILLWLCNDQCWYRIRKELFYSREEYRKRSVFQTASTLPPILKERINMKDNMQKAQILKSYLGTFITNSEPCHHPLCGRYLGKTAFPRYESLNLKGGGN